MKIINLTFILIALSCFQSFSQWTPTNGPYGGYAKGIFSIDGSLVLVSGFGNFYSSSVDSIAWKPSTGEAPKQITKIIQNGASLYACTYGGVFATEDYGETWQRAFPELPYDTVINIFIHDKIIFASVTNPTAVVQALVVYSTDNGENWSTLEINGNRIGSDSFAATKSADTLIIGTANGLYISYNAGQTWIKKLETPDPSTTPINGVYIHGDTLFACSSKGVHFSTDFGQTFQDISLSEQTLNLVFSGAAIYAICSYGGFNILEKSPAGYKKVRKSLEGISLTGLCAINGKLLAATRVGAGCLLSSDNGITWENANRGYQEALISCFANYKDTLIANINGLGLFATSDKGNNWAPWEEVSENLTYFKISMNDKTGYALTYNQKPYIKITTNGGKAWKYEGSNLYAKGVRDILALPGGRCLAATDGGIYKSTDLGETWFPVDSSLLETNFVTLSRNSRVIFAGSGKGVLKTTDEGMTWNYIDYEFEFSDVIGVECDEELAVAYAGNGIIYVSKDDGGIWNSITVPFQRISKLVLFGKYIFIDAYEDSLYISKDFGQTWQTIGEDLIDSGIFSLYVFGENIYAGTMKRGVYKAKLADFGINGAYEKKLNPIVLATPNPAGDFLVFQGIDPPFEAQIFNCNGIKVMTSTNNNRIELEGLPTGSYFCLINKGIESRAVKFTIYR